MSPLFSGLLLTTGAVLLWRSGWATRRRESRRLQKQMRAADFWTSWKPRSEPVNGTPSPAAPIMADDLPTVETCDRCGPYVVAAHFAIRGPLLIGLCGHCGTRHHVALIADGWELLHALVPVKAVAHG